MVFRGISLPTIIWTDYEKREVLARVKDFVAVLINSEPKTKSEPVNLDGSGTVTQWW